MNMDVVMEALGIMGKGMLGICHRVAGLPVDQNHLPEKVLTHGMRGAGLGGSPFSVSKK